MATTEDRDLRSGLSVWKEPPLIGKPLNGDLRVDVLVIGGGVTGVLLAERLSHHFSVAVVDERGAARGSTTASTGLLLFEVDTPLIELRKKIGRDNADRAWIRSDRAMRELLKRIERLRIECDMTRCDSIYLPGDTLDAEGLAEEAQARIECRLPSRWVHGAELRSRYPVEGKAAIISGNSARVNPVRFALGFLQHAMSRDTQVFSKAEITGIESTGSGVIAWTKEGPTVTAKFAVFATGYEMPKYLSAPGKEVASTWVIATVAQPIEPSIHSALIWEAADPYYYVRTTDDGRAIVGGEDEDFDDENRRKELTPAKAKKLQEKLRTLFPQLDPTIDFAWSGTFGTSDTGLPSMGAIPGKPNCYAVLGFGGNGMTYAEIGAQLIERMLLGETDPDADLFKLS